MTCPNYCRSYLARTSKSFAFLQKPGKTGADLDLPPHMLNKQGAPPQAASSKPPLSHQSNSSVSGKATVLPIPMTAQTQASPGGKVKKTHDQFPGKARARATEEESSVSSRASTPSGKGKQHSQDSGGVNGRSEPPLLSSPSSARKVVPIKLDRAPRQSEHQPKISRQPGDAAQHAAASNDPQVWYEQWVQAALQCCYMLNVTGKLGSTTNHAWQHCFFFVTCSRHDSLLLTCSEHWCTCISGCRAQGDLAL